MGSRLSPEEEQVEALKAECSDTGCKIQSLQAETESIRALVRQAGPSPVHLPFLYLSLTCPFTLPLPECHVSLTCPFPVHHLTITCPSTVGPQKRGLENSLSDIRHWHDMELQNLGSVVAKLEAELGDVRAEIEQQRRDYNTLLSNKQRLEQEIGLYHGILDGEESRFQQATKTP